MNKNSWKDKKDKLHSDEKKKESKIIITSDMVLQGEKPEKKSPRNNLCNIQIQYSVESSLTLKSVYS